MPLLTLRQIAKCYGLIEVLRGLDLKVESTNLCRREASSN